MIPDKIFRCSQCAKRAGYPFYQGKKIELRTCEICKAEQAFCEKVCANCGGNGFVTDDQDEFIDCPVCDGEDA